MKKKVIISGIAGMDGSYLAEYLLGLGYEVHGMLRASQTNPYTNIEKIKDKVKLFIGDLLDDKFLSSIDYSVYDEFYHLAAQSHVGVSFSIPDYTKEVNFVATLKLLNHYFTGRDKVLDPNVEGNKSKSRFYFAGTSELFGRQPAPQNEKTQFDPISPYAESKKNSMDMCQVFRDHGRFVTSAILFNHESLRRGKQFVTQKIIQAILEYKKDNSKNILVLGNYDAKRDWGYSPEYVQVMHSLMQLPFESGNFVVATNETHTIKEFIEEALLQSEISNYQIFENVSLANIDYQDIYNYPEMLIDHNTFYVVQSKDYFRPAEVNILQGDYSKVQEAIGWTPKVKFKELISIMLGISPE